MGGNEPQPPYGDYPATASGPVPMLHQMVERLSTDVRRLRDKLAARAEVIRRLQSDLDTVLLADQSVQKMERQMREAIHPTPAVDIMEEPEGKPSGP